MAIISNYNTLVAAIQEMSEDDSAEFLAFIPTAIDLAEELLFKELDLPDLETKATGTLTINNPVLVKPGGYEFCHYLRITASSQEVTLRKRTEDYLVDYWPNSTTTGVPKYFADSSSTEFRLAPTPDLAYNYTLKYSAQPPKLTASNQTNYFITQCKDILFNAVMAEMSRFMKAWSQVQPWEAKYVALRDDWNIQMARKRRNDPETPGNGTGPNSLKHTVQTAS